MRRGGQQLAPREDENGRRWVEGELSWEKVRERSDSFLQTNMRAQRKGATDEICAELLSAVVWATVG